MSNQLEERRIAFLTANEGVEQVELVEPWGAVRDAGGECTLIATEAGEVQGFHHLTRADTFGATVASAAARVDDYDGLVLPGGVANPDQLRTDAAAVSLVASFFDAHKPVAAICHAPWTLVEARVTAGRTLTSWPSLRTDISNSGGTWVDREVVVCTNGPNTLITSRNPDDIPVFNDALVAAFAHGSRRVEMST